MNLENQPMLILYELSDEPGTFAIESTLATTNVGAYIRGVVGVGYPYYAFAQNQQFSFNIWDGYVPDWTGAPICSSSVDTNNSNIMAMLDNPPLSKISPPA